METIKQQIEEVLNRTLPHKVYRNVWVGKFMDTQYVGIVIAASDYEINRVRGQFPQDVSLCLDENLELYPQAFGGNGGQSIYCIPDRNNPKEKYLAMASRRVPFRKPKKEIRFVLGAVERFAQNWVATLKENKSILMYQDYVNYDELLNS